MILFLDYDGVMHPDATYLIKGRPVLHAEGSLFMWASSLVEALRPYPQVRIILSTSWVRTLGYSRARKALPDPLRDRAIGATWHSAMGRSHFSGSRLGGTWWDEATRYEQIACYVERAHLKNWVAIDDHGECWPEKHADNLILTDSAQGISSPLALALLHARLAAWAASSHDG